MLAPGSAPADQREPLLARQPPPVVITFGVHSKRPLRVAGHHPPGREPCRLAQTAVRRSAVITPVIPGGPSWCRPTNTSPSPNTARRVTHSSIVAGNVKWQPAGRCSRSSDRASDVVGEASDRRGRVRRRRSPAGVAGTCGRLCPLRPAYDLAVLRRMDSRRFPCGEPAANTIGPAAPIGRTAVRHVRLGVTGREQPGLPAHSQATSVGLAARVRRSPQSRGRGNSSQIRRGVQPVTP